VNCFVDTDALHKLAAFDLWAEACAVLGVSRKDVLLLPTALFVLGLKDPAKSIRRHGPVLASRLQAIIAACGTAMSSPAVDDLLALTGVLGIDPGEAVLIALSSRSAGSLLVTGDKRSLRALAAEPRCAAIVQRLAGRVVTLEQILHLIVSTYPFEALTAKVVPAVAIDTAIRAIWGSGPLAKRKGVLEGLEAYIHDLRSQTDGLLKS
jgi:hypothetical protein